MADAGIDASRSAGIRVPAATADLAHIRKTLRLGIPVAFLLMIGAGYFTFWSIPELLQELNASAPVIRIWPSIVMGPVMLPFLFLTVAVVTMKAIPIGTGFTDRAVAWIHVLLIMNFLTMLLTLTASTFLQGHFMPKRGYIQCTELKDHSYIWFSDWMRDPAWCVKGKTLDWVKAQAG